MSVDGSRPPYRPIADHAVIGNQNTCALVSRDGVIVWCCFPELDDASVFGSILDQRKGGRFGVTARGGTVRTQRYIDLTAVLVTISDAPGGELSVTDFMPVRGSIAGCGNPGREPEIYRIIRCESGEVEVEVEWAPRFDYARARTTIESTDGGFIARGDDATMTLAGVANGHIEGGEYGPTLRASLRLVAGEMVTLITRFGSTVANPDLPASDAALRDTVEAWRGWMREAGTEEDFAWAGQHEAMVYRSAIVLKLLTHPGTGAIAAAPTTSLPEDIGGVRNWDYRYTWIRDASFTVQALLTLGHGQEARDFVEFAERAAMNEAAGDQEVKIMYDLRGNLAPAEEELEHLEGYEGSRPVRIGNEARFQIQHDVYGELIDCAFELIRRGEKLEREIFDFLARLADLSCEVWREPDAGIWEFRAEPKHYTYSKLMVWVALDRAVRLAEHHGLKGDVERWRRNRDELRQEILARGYNEQLGAFAMAYDSDDLDAANLRMASLEFLPCSDSRVQGTIDRTLEHLTRDGMVYRYLVDDGLPGHEGTFGLCTFWMIEVLALSGRIGEARAMFEGMAARANHVGLYSEEIAPGSGRFLGNFPQAFTHIGFITSLLYLAAAEGLDHHRLSELEGMSSMCPAPGPRHAERGTQQTAWEGKK